MSQADERAVALMSFDQTRISISGSVLEELAEAAESFVPPITCSGFDRSTLPVSDSIVIEFDRIRQRVVDGSAGYAVLDGLRSIATPRWAASFFLISASIGVPREQDRHGTLIREVKDRGTRIGEGESARYSDSRYGGSLHTDGAEAPLPVPDYFTLLCVRQAPMGGEFVMAYASTVYERLLQEDEQAVEVLAQPFHFDRRGDVAVSGERTALKPVFFRENGKTCVTYLREYIEAGHRHPNAPALTPIQRRALDTLDRVLADKSLLVVGRLEPGELIVIDNKRMFHGRHTFQNGAETAQQRL